MGLLSNVRKACETTFKNGWASTTPVRWPNVPFKQPADGLFVVFGIQFGVSNITSLGTSKREEQSGLVVVTINTPREGGAEPAMVLADQAQALFRCKQLTEGGTTINFYECSAGSFGESATGFSGNCYMRFKADQLFDS